VTRRAGNDGGVRLIFRNSATGAIAPRLDDTATMRNNSPGARPAASSAEQDRPWREEDAGCR
jgi:hypothetical protein